MRKTPTLARMIDAGRAGTRHLKRDFFELVELQSSSKVSEFAQKSIARAEQEITCVLLSNAEDHRTVVTPRFRDQGTSARFQWWISACDNEANFERAIPSFATSIALLDLETNKAVAGVVIVPMMQSVIYCECGTSSWREVGSNSFASKVRTSIQERGGLYLDSHAQLATCGPALALSYLASGNISALRIEKAHRSDCLAGAIIATEAGSSIEMIDLDHDDVSLRSCHV